MRTGAALQFFGGLCGAAGVALSAAAAHSGGGPAGAAAMILLTHAGAFLALSLMAVSRPLAIGATLLAVGILLFALDMALRTYAGGRLFPMAAPLGGVGMIAGWLVIAVSALAGRRSDLTQP